MRLRTLLLPLAATTMLGTAAAPAGAFSVASAPQLYAVSDAAQGRPVAYLVFRGSSHLHDVRQVQASVHGHTGRAYSVGRTCVRVAFVVERADGTPVPFLRAGHRYRVTVRWRPTGRALTSVTLTARRAASTIGAAPRC
jgi:hypothetical protein